VTGASSGIGEATVRTLAGAGFETVAAARRVERCRALADEVGGRAIELDVADAASVDALASEIGELDVVVHSAGGAHGLDRVDSSEEERWRTMYETNVIGVMLVTKALLPALRRSERGHIVIIGSLAGVEVYEGGAGYTAAKHAVNALSRTLRLEHHSEGIRVTEVAPGLVETEFSLVRFGGDAERAAGVYEGLDALTAEDIADIVAFAVTRPVHVDIDYVSIKPTAQASATVVHRRD
jgi:NADP-dependent 3-hydroxy acid dehydrogenase YdfG